MISPGSSGSPREERLERDLGPAVPAGDLDLGVVGEERGEQFAVELARSDAPADGRLCPQGVRCLPAGGLPHDGGDLVGSDDLLQSRHGADGEGSVGPQGDHVEAERLQVDHLAGVTVGAGIQPRPPTDHRRRRALEAARTPPPTTAAASTVRCPPSRVVPPGRGRNEPNVPPRARIRRAGEVPGRGSGPSPPRRRRSRPARSPGPGSAPARASRWRPCPRRGSGRRPCRGPRPRAP